MKTFQDFIAELITEQEKHNPRRLTEAADTAKDRLAAVYAYVVALEEPEGSDRSKQEIHKHIDTMKHMISQKYGNDWFRKFDKVVSSMKDYAKRHHRLDTESSDFKRTFGASLQELGIDIKNFGNEMYKYIVDF